MKPRRATLVVLLGAASAVALLASIFATTHERIYRWWWNRKHGVPVVRTWDELRARTPVELENGEKVRLGVEATRFGAGGGILVCCLMEDMPGAPVLPSSPAKGGPLGPLLVSLRRAGEEPQSETSPSELWLYREARVDEIPFFAHPVVAAQPGRHWLDVRARSGDVLATVLLHVDPEPFHPFVPWGTPRPRPRTEPEPRHGRDGVRETEVHVSGGSAVRPAWDGWSPVRIPPDGVRTLVPTRTGPPRATTSSRAPPGPLPAET